MNSEEAQNQRRMDEALTTLGSDYPRLWRRLYENLRIEKFTHEDSMTLLMTFIMSNSPNGVFWNPGRTAEGPTPEAE